MSLVSTSFDVVRLILLVKENRFLIGDILTDHVEDPVEEDSSKDLAGERCTSAISEPNPDFLLLSKSSLLVAFPDFWFFPDKTLPSGASTFVLTMLGLSGVAITISLSLERLGLQVFAVDTNYIVLNTCKGILLAIWRMFYLVWNYRADNQLTNVNEMSL